MSDEPTLWPDDQLPRHEPRIDGGNFKSLRHPLWTQNKALLIQAYLQLFQLITHHGTYIDGFAAPQKSEHLDMWAARLVLQMEPKWFREFWLCDISPDGIEKLQDLRSEHMAPNRRVHVVEGDFNETVREVLAAGTITERTATFALLDQRTFECEWQTVEALSRHKVSNKIELFYFFPSGWIDRSITAVRVRQTEEKVKRWWGRDDWRDLCGIDGTTRAKMVAKRFEDELGYKSVYPYAIHSERRGGRVMYHMIHATDHPEAPRLMIRAYRKVSGRSELVETELQRDMEELWNELQKDS